MILFAFRYFPEGNDAVETGGEEELSGLVLVGLELGEEGGTDAADDVIVTDEQFPEWE